eukprot:4649580-Pyramimonas_sp.AAC.1
MQEHRFIMGLLLDWLCHMCALLDDQQTPRSKLDPAGTKQTHRGQTQMRNRLRLTPARPNTL